MHQILENSIKGQNVLKLRSIWHSVNAGIAAQL
jgi:hypothetical protein